MKQAWIWMIVALMIVGTGSLALACGDKADGSAAKTPCVGSSAKTPCAGSAAKMPCAGSGTKVEAAPVATESAPEVESVAVPVAEHPTASSSMKHEGSGRKPMATPVAMDPEPKPMGSGFKHSGSGTK